MTRGQYVNGEREATAWDVIEYAAPAGEKQEVVQRVMSTVRTAEPALR
ncbi:hypothetical protein AB0J35_50625 [Nonomuraea angiospora]